MEILTGLIATLLGAECEIDVETGGDGTPKLTLSTGGRLCLEPDCVVVEDVDDDTKVEALAVALGVASPLLRRIHDFASRFPCEVETDGQRVLCTLGRAWTGEALGPEGLRGLLRLAVYVDGELANVMESETVVISAAALAASWDEFTALLDAFDARRLTWADQLPELYPDDVCLEPAKPDEPPDDAGWEDFQASLGLVPETAEAHVTPAVGAAFGAFPGVRAHYESIYGLPLPPGLAVLAALVDALGALPENPPLCHWVPEAGPGRGGAWLDAALSMRPAGLSTWFQPGALDRRTRDAAESYDTVPPGGEGPLDPRLDMRYRCDAPQFVTFLGGDSDGLHWGFWYDSPAHAPVIAHNYARDSAETWLDGTGDMLVFLRNAHARAVESAREALADEANDPSPDDGGPGYALAHVRALRVVATLLDAVEAVAAPFLAETPSAPDCPWPRTAGKPTGSPALALAPDAGQPPAHVVSYQGTAEGGEPATRLAWIAEARRALEDGRPAYAHALGLYLHWLDADDLREAAGALLLDAYTAQGFHAFAEILRIHLRHRDLPSVGVFRDD